MEYFYTNGISCNLAKFEPCQIGSSGGFVCVAHARIGKPIITLHLDSMYAIAWYNNRDFLDELNWAIVHEICHTLGFEHEPIDRGWP